MFSLRYLLEALPSKEPFHTQLLIELWNRDNKNFVDRQFSTFRHQVDKFI